MTFQERQRPHDQYVGKHFHIIGCGIALFFLVLLYMIFIGFGSKTLPPFLSGVLTAILISIWRDKKCGPNGPRFLASLFNAIFIFVSSVAIGCLVNLASYRISSQEMLEVDIQKHFIEPIKIIFFFGIPVTVFGWMWYFLIWIKMLAQRYYP